MAGGNITSHECRIAVAWEGVGWEEVAWEEVAWEEVAWEEVAWERWGRDDDSSSQAAPEEIANWLIRG